MNLSAFSNPIQLDIQKGICKIEEREYPIVGFGTYPLRGKSCNTAVEQAIRSGYRIIDTATYYENFDAISKVLKGQDRRCFYLISKVWHDRQLPKDLRKDLEMTLEELQTDYLDAYLLHWPNSQISIKDVLLTMNELRQAKKIHHIGLSNVSVNHLKRALEVGIPISWVQIEMHPHFCDFALMKFCHQHSIIIQAWRPLDLGRIRENNTLTEIGERYGKSSCQIALRWIVQHGCIPLPGSQNENHIQQNLDIRDFTLSEEEMRKIDQMALKGTRFRLKEDHGLGFTDEFDFSYEDCWPN